MQILFYLYLTVQGLHWYAWAFSSCGDWELLFERRLLYSLSCSGTQALGVQASEVVAHRLSCPHGMWNPPRPGIKHLPCIRRWILNHWTTREDPKSENNNHVYNMFCNFHLTSLILNMPVYPMKIIKFHCS